VLGKATTVAVADNSATVAPPGLESPLAMSAVVDGHSAAGMNGADMAAATEVRSGTIFSLNTRSLTTGIEIVGAAIRAGLGIPSRGVMSRHVGRAAVSGIGGTMRPTGRAAVRSIGGTMRPSGRASVCGIGGTMRPASRGAVGSISGGTVRPAGRGAVCGIGGTMRPASRGAVGGIGGRTMRPAGRGAVRGIRGGTMRSTGRASVGRATCGRVCLRLGRRSRLRR